MADLMRISGVGQEYPELLEAAGVFTVKEQHNRNAENLAARMTEANASRNLTRTMPSEKTVAGWVAQSRQPDPLITH
jgi:predicted flap endonuclease-1-like 5' DNA nuclease